MKIKMFVRSVAVSLIFFVFFGCATQSVMLSSNDSLSEEEGCIYGQFGLIDYDKDFIFGNPLVTSNIVVENIVTEKKYGFRLQGEENDDLQVLAVPAGQYIVKEIEYLGKNDLGAWVTKKSKDFKITNYENSFTVDQNTAVYLGDFFGTAHYDWGNLSWNVFPPVNSFEETTKELKEKYPLFVENSTNFVSHINTTLISNEELEKYLKFKDALTGK